MVCNKASFICLVVVVLIILTLLYDRSTQVLERCFILYIVSTGSGKIALLGCGCGLHARKKRDSRKCNCLLGLLGTSFTTVFFTYTKFYHSFLYMHLPTTCLTWGIHEVHGLSSYAKIGSTCQSYVADPGYVTTPIIL